MSDEMRGLRLTGPQMEARLAILKDVARSGGRDRWSHLHSHGHNYGRVIACVNRGELSSASAYHYALTEKGRALLAQAEQEVAGDG